MSHNNINELPPAEQLWDLFDYDPFTGFLIHRTTRSRAKIDEIAGKHSSTQYIQLGINGITYAAHRVVYKWVTGKDPEGILEHKDDNGRNNRFWNLLDSDVHNNNVTRSLIKNGSLGQKDSNGAWRARICIEGKVFNLGSFQTKEEAHEAHMSAMASLNKNPNWRPSPHKTLRTGRSSNLRYASRHGKRWQASYRFKSQYYYVGQFDTEQEAHDAAVLHREQTISASQPKDHGASPAVG